MAMECCPDMSLKEITHPVYRCQNCRKKVRLVKVERIEVQAIGESKERRP